MNARRAAHVDREIPPRFDLLRLGDVLPQGWIRRQMERDLQGGFAGRLDRLTAHASHDLFRQRIGRSDDQTAWWDGESRGNWLWGLAMMARLAGGPDVRARLAAMLSDLEATQEPDGYLGIYVPEARFRHANENGELWAQSRALLALLTHYEATGQLHALQAVEKAVGLTMRQYGPHRPYFNHPGADYRYSYITGVTHGLNYVDALEWLYRLTGNTQYRDYGVWLYRDFNSLPGRFVNDDLKTANLRFEHIPFAGHAVHTAEHLRVLLFAARMTGDPELAEGVDNAFRRLARYTVPSGALVGDESVHGMAFPDLGYEYCTTTELALSLISALQKLGQARFGDHVESLVFNAAQGARLPDGTAIAYLSADNRLAADNTRPDSYQGTPLHGGRFKYSPTHEDVAVCCNPNAVRLLPHYVAGMWMRAHDGSGVAACLYGPSTLSVELGGVRVTIDETTAYPFSDEVVLTITPEAEVEFALHLRRPGWAAAMTLAAPGCQQSGDADFVTLRKQWRRGDEVHLTFAPRVEAVPTVTGEYAIRRGPLLAVMAIPHQAEVIRRYPLEDFADLSFYPADQQQAYHTPLIDLSQPDLGLSLHANPQADLIQPWDASPLELRGQAGTFVPMGCTVLRRATFPALRR